jgi:malate dehydrogenase
LQRNFKVALLGAAGGIGQPLGLLLKMNPLITQLALYDIVHTLGVAADISHCSTPAQVTGHLGPQSLRDALEGSAVVVIPAGVPRKPGKFMILKIHQLFLLLVYSVMCMLDIGDG